MIEINNLSKSYGINKIFENESITLTSRGKWYWKIDFFKFDYPT